MNSITLHDVRSVEVSKWIKTDDYEFKEIVVVTDGKKLRIVLFREE